MACSTQEVAGYDSLKTARNKNAPKVVTLIRRRRPSHSEDTLTMLGWWTPWRLSITARGGDQSEGVWTASLSLLHPPPPGLILWGVSHHQWQPLTLTNHSITSLWSKLFSSIGEQFKPSFITPKVLGWCRVRDGTAEAFGTFKPRWSVSASRMIPIPQRNKVQ